MSPRADLRSALAERDVPRIWLFRAAVVVLVLALCTPAAASYVTYEETSHQRGTLESVAENETVISIQGFHFEGEGSSKKPSGLVGVDGRAQTEWTLNGSEADWPVDTVDQSWWFYDVDPLPNGNFLVVNTFPGETFVHEYDPETGERIWGERFPEMVDTHDVAYLNDEEIAIANMRNYDEEAGVSDDRVVIYNRTQGEITWEWYFREHYPADMDGGMNEDWSHVNDVDPVGEDRLLLSPRNFDQAIVVNRTTGDIVMQLGEDGNHSVLNEQHNPDYFESEDGTPTMLVADSENDRIVEYALTDECERPEGVEKAGNRLDCEWELVWELGGPEQFNWPRDADRLPNGNTLVTDSLNHRVIEVTPTGEIVWEYYVGWGPYDAERGETESSGPTMQDMNVSGSYDVNGSAGLEPGTGNSTTLAGWMSAMAAGTPAEASVDEAAQRWSHVAPWIYPVWMSDWDFAYVILAVVLSLVWAVYEGYRKRGVVVDAVAG
ncbi:aryl-sulfate sulfotransferase [Natronomonas marina]|uniref:aryl-sulfate sulfotransferase n=1 Tax=Natronomonas marina TaxID=2961939 RepID=UPI0020C98006|nr:aryl-sulfate sulfotransferase [Natronomonas marina]